MWWFFPHMVIPLFVGREKSVKSLDAAMRGDRLVVLVTQTDPQITAPVKKDLYEVGTVAEILQMLKMPNGTIKVLVEGLSRAYITSMDEANDEFFEGSIRMLDDVSSEPAETLHSVRGALIESFEKYIRMNKKVPAEALTTVGGIEELSHLADVVASHINLRVELKQSLVELGDPVERARQLTHAD